MQTYPSLPAVDDASERFRDGHLWVQEWVDGAHLRFRMDESGLLRFGDRNRVFDPDAVPPHYRYAVRHVRESLDRDALRGAVDDVSSVVFFAVATVRRRVDYDWDRTPAVLGFDVHAGDGFIPPDAAERAFSRLGLRPVNAFAKEVRARDFDPGTYAVPASAWYDGPAAGAVVSKKAGGRAKLPNPDALTDPDPILDADPGAYATPERVERAAAALRERSQSATVEAVAERLFEAFVRERYARLDRGRSTVTLDHVRRALRARTDRLLGGSDAPSAADG